MHEGQRDGLEEVWEENTVLRKTGLGFLKTILCPFGKNAVKKESGFSFLKNVLCPFGKHATLKNNRIRFLKKRIMSVWEKRGFEKNGKRLNVGIKQSAAEFYLSSKRTLQRKTSRLMESARVCP